MQQAMMISGADTVTAILDVAVRHHLPDDAVLAAAFARRSADAALAALGDPEERAVAAATRLGRLINLFREALREDRRACVCGMLSADVSSLPAPVAAELRHFFDRVVDWTSRVIGHEAAGGRAADPRMRALRVLATLQGAVVVARAEGEPAVFDGITADVAREALRVAPRSIGGVVAERCWPSQRADTGRIDEGLSAVY